jgi:hypothetical protein
MFTLVFVILALVLINATLVSYFGSQEALSMEIRDIVEKKKSLKDEMKKIVLASSPNTLLVLSMTLLVGIGSLVSLLAEILKIDNSAITDLLSVYGFCGIFFFMGLVSIVKRETPGFLKWHGVSAVIWGWIILVISVSIPVLFTFAR